MDENPISERFVRTRRRRARWAKWSFVAVSFVIAGAVIGWASAKVLTPAQDILEATSYTYVSVIKGQVGSSIAASATASWTSTPAGTNIAAGTVTTLDYQSGQEAASGTILYTVDLRPVVVAQGDVPSFRDLKAGDVGPDVAQAQTMLRSLGFYKGKADGKYSSSTQAAVRAWQKNEKVDPDGELRAGDVIYVPRMPARLSLNGESIARGSVLSGGESVVGVLPDAPDFRVPVTAAQAVLAPVETKVSITGPSGQAWVGAVAEQAPSPTDGSVSLVLRGLDGAPICGNECESVPVSKESSLAAQVITVETATGLTLPSAALLTKADGKTVVIDEGDVEHPVSVTNSARGISLVEGIPDGLRVRIPVAGK